MNKFILIMCLFPSILYAHNNTGAVKDSCVEILADGHLESSGWIADSAGYVLTVSHIAPASKYEAVSPVYGRLSAELVALDCGHDLALFKLPPSKKGYAALRLAGKFPETGSEIIMYGSPLSRRDFFLFARVARVNTGFEFYRNQKYFIEVNYASGQAPNGISGGPWINASGEVVGMQSGTVLQYSIPQGIICSSPLDAIKRIISVRVSSATIDIGANMLDFEFQSAQYIAKFPAGIRGAAVIALTDEGSAKKNRMQEGDLIVSADDAVISGVENFLRMIRAKKPGEDIVLGVYDPAGQHKRMIRMKLESVEDRQMKILTGK